MSSGLRKEQTKQYKKPKVDLYQAVVPSGLTTMKAKS